MVKKTMSSFKKPGFLFLILTITVLLGLILTAFYMRKGNVIEGFTQKVSIEYFCMSGCPFCDKFESTWEKFVKHVDTATTELPYTYKKYNISTSEGEKRGKAFNVNSAPTVLAIKNDAVIASMETNRTFENLVKFAEENTSTSVDNE